MGANSFLLERIPFQMGGVASLEGVSIPLSLNSFTCEKRIAVWTSMLSAQVKNDH